MGEGFKVVFGFILLCMVGSAIMVGSLKLAKDVGFISTMSEQDRQLIEALTRERKAAADAMNRLAAQLEALQAKEEQAR